MSILKKPYTISVWDDVWNAATGKFEEQRVGIIGADNMLYQGRAIEPNLIRNVNGTKKFSFKMYKYFTDNETGERVENPFVSWLVSERKVKLQYKGKWYDFIVKNINENSSNYLYTYQLEDALVQELSKNGFGVTLDTKLMNNMGTAGQLATYVLNETDWNVSSEALVEKVEDNLVYVTIPKGMKVRRILDQTDLDVGIDDTQEIELDTTWNVLAFYTSCTSKPHRFQFIYIPEGYYVTDSNGKRTPSVSTDENRIINVKNCQYYYEVQYPEAKDSYKEVPNFEQFYLPNGFGVVGFGDDGISNNHDTTISVWYRGHRYGFAQGAKYIPVLDRYCNIYHKNGEKYYGFVDNEYNSPTLLQNVITNTEFKSTTGWVGTYCGDAANAKAKYGATIETIYGRFDENGFTSVVDELSNGNYSSETKYTPYLKIDFPDSDESNKSILINTGFYDNRTLIGEVDYDEEWYFEPTILVNGNTINPWDAFDFKLQEVSFNTTTGAYNLGKIWAEVPSSGDRLKFNSAPLRDTNGNIVESSTHADVKISKKDFKKKEIKLVITPKNTGKQTYYIKDMQLFKLVLNDDDYIVRPDELTTEGVIKSTYRFFPASYVEDNGEIKQGVVDVEAIKYENFDKTAVDYELYVPQYNQGAQKVRSVDAKESNYFNILQSIAEKFEAWLELEIGRNNDGGVVSKTVKFKNYAGKDNHASFRYGVNLKDIQRTYESKNIVTKLIVKQNSNEHAQNGFCTIARAGANQTGENYIYDFRYYHDSGMLDKIEYVAGLYYSENIYHEGLKEAGPDVNDSDNTYNLQNYFNRVKNLNTKIQNINEVIAPKQTELIKLNAELAVQEGLRDAAAEGLEEVREDFEVLTGVTPETISNATATIDTSASNIQSLLTEYATYMAQYDSAKELAGYKKPGKPEIKGSLQTAVENKEAEIKELQEEIEALLEHKKELNKLFYSRYSRFIQEGTWIDEKYIDDDKYYADAQSVMYNSCYPQVAYTINVVALSALPGYEHFEFELGDKTYAIDPEFFGEDKQEAVIINELSENLDDPSRDQIKVQNFKNQFQDLFQKITATVQQTQYSSGSYEKAVALAEANATVKSEFLQDAFNSADDTLSKAGQTSVKWGDNGITLTDSDTKNEMRLIGGAILMSIQDENGQRKWKTGLTPEGISASLVTAGTVDTGKIQIKNGKDVTFLWNSFGISAFDVDWNNGEVVGTPDTSKFVRFDKHGIYGMDISADTMKDGMSWTPTDSKNIDKDATFALTWEGLKVTGNEGVIARIGKQDEHIVYITDGNGQPIFQVNNNGSSEIAGWTVSSQTGYTGGFYHDVKADGNDKPTHRFGLKIEDGSDDRYAFYVKKFTPNQQSWDKPHGDLVFGVKYDGSMTAKVGKVGDWILGPIEDKVTGLYYSNDNNDSIIKAGMATSPWKTDPVFWAGYTGNGDTPWGHNDKTNNTEGDQNDNTEDNWRDHTPFYVTGEGKVVCKNIEATGGQIGGALIKSEQVDRLKLSQETTQVMSKETVVVPRGTPGIIDDINDKISYGTLHKFNLALPENTCLTSFSLASTQIDSNESISYTISENVCTITYGSIYDYRPNSPTTLVSSITKVVTYTYEYKEISVEKQTRHIMDFGNAINYYQDTNASSFYIKNGQVDVLSVNNTISKSANLGLLQVQGNAINSFGAYIEFEKGPSSEIGIYIEDDGSSIRITKEGGSYEYEDIDCEITYCYKSQLTGKEVFNTHKFSKDKKNDFIIIIPDFPMMKGSAQLISPRGELVSKFSYGSNDSPRVILGPNITPARTTGYNGLVGVKARAWRDGYFEDIHVLVGDDYNLAENWRSLKDFLTFKGPITIYYGGIEVGKMFQLGTIVYGALRDTNPIRFSDSSYFTFKLDGENYTPPNPKDDATFIYPYTLKDPGLFEGANRTATIKICSSGTVLQYTGNESNAQTYHHWGYFVYSINEKYSPNQ